MRLIVVGLFMFCCFMVASCAPSTNNETVIQSPALSAATTSPSTLAPATTLSPSVPEGFSEMLSLLNQARSQARSCGNDSFVAAPPLSYNPVLSRSAEVHALDMQQKKFFGHTGSDGSDVGVRVSRTGYNLARAAENLAYATAERYTAAEIVNGWLDSPGHCKNIMNPVFKEVGLAKHSVDYDYWVHVFGVAN